MNPILEIKNIDKSFPGVHALDCVSFCCYPGTVHVLQGENGAGKSTLLKILSGLYQPDKGEVLLNGVPAVFKHPQDAKNKGIAMVYQEMTILPDLTVAQNICLNQEQRYGKKGKGLIRENALIKHTCELAAAYGIEVDPYATAGDLPIANQQMLEILKALNTDPDILILDEPTSSLTKTEVEKLYRIVEGLKKKGKTILFISHRMEEVFRFGDTMTVLKDGQYIDTVKIADVTEDDVIRMMVGRDAEDIYPPKTKECSSEVLFQLKDFGDGGLVKDVNLEIYKGEVLGISALDGQGQTQLMQAIAGARRHTGKVILHDKPMNYSSTGKALDCGIGYVPEDRKYQALCLSLSVGENLSMASLSRYAKAGFLSRKKENAMIAKQISNMNIRTPSAEQMVGHLSGGNQQKVSLGKSLAGYPKVLLLNDPTRGIDVEAKQEVYRLVRSLADKGVAICVYSSDLMEVIGLSDRVLTMFEGRVTSELAGEDINEETIMSCSMNLQQKHSGLRRGGKTYA